MSKRAEEAARKAYNRFTAENIDDVLRARHFFQEGYEQAEKDTIERACEWLFSRLSIMVDYYNEDIYEKADRTEFIKKFRIDMEDEK